MRLRSMPSSFSIIQRMGRAAAIQLDRGANRLPQTDKPVDIAQRAAPAAASRGVSSNPPETRS